MAENKQAPEHAPGTQVVSPQINLDPNLITAIAIAVAKALPQATIDVTAIAKAVGDSVGAAIQATAPVKRVSFGEYLREVNKGRAFLTRRVYQNGIQIFGHNLSNEEVTLFNSISRSGRYIDRLVEVGLAVEDGNEIVYLKYNDKKDAMLILKDHIHNLTDMLRQIVAAQKVEDEEDEAAKLMKEEMKVKAKEIRERHFGNSKTTQAARTAAGVE